MKCLADIPSFDAVIIADATAVHRKRKVTRRGKAPGCKQLHGGAAFGLVRIGVMRYDGFAVLGGALAVP